MRKSGIAVAGIPGFASAFVRPVPWYSPLAAAKIAAFKECGVEVAVTPSDMADALIRAAKARGVLLT